MPGNVPLTRRQLALLRYIHGHIVARGVSPTLRECARDLGYQSPGGLHQLLDRLVDRGAIRLLPNKARGVEVLTPPSLPMINGTPLYAVPIALSRVS